MTDPEGLAKKLAAFAVGGALGDPERREKFRETLAHFGANSGSPDELGEIFRRRVGEANFSAQERALMLAALNVDLEAGSNRYDRVVRAMEAAGLSLYGISHPQISTTVKKLSNRLVRATQPAGLSREVGRRSQTRSLRVESRLAHPRRAPTIVYEYRSVYGVEAPLKEWIMSPAWQGLERPTWEHSGDGEFHEPDIQAESPALRVTFDPPVAKADFLIISRFPESSEDRSHGSFRYRFISEMNSLHFQVKFPSPPEYVAYIECSHPGDWPTRPDYSKELSLQPQGGGVALADFKTSPTPHREVGLLWVWNSLTISNNVLHWS